MQILLTGGAGFIGSWVGERLLDQGHEVVCIDNFNDFYDPTIKRENIHACLRHANYELCDGDITDRALIDDLFESHAFDAIIHLAAWAGVRPSIERPEIYEQVNLGGTLNLLQRARMDKISRFVFASSSSVYGGRTDPPFSEDDSVSRPVSPYAATKRSGELLCYTFHHLFELDISCLRYFTVYGPRQRPDMAFHKFLRAILEDQPIPVYGDGMQTRDFTYIEDIVRGTLAAGFSEISGEVINLGGGTTIALKNVFEILEAVTQKKLRLAHEEAKAGDMRVTFADIGKARRLLGFEPRFDLIAGLEREWRWLRDMYDS
jgi:UDP-glucuronate 4-epimerase